MGIEDEIYQCILEEGEDIEKITMLIEKGEKLNLNKKFDSKSLLHHATFLQKAKIVDLLLKKKVNPNIEDKILSTPLHYSAQKGNNDITVLLLGHGADVNFRDEFGHTPIFLALKKNYFEVCDTLLLFGADIR
jgi:uncharacterized protein